ncbi:hypothetical protein ACFVJ5_07120 [Nocardia sp. NPDC127606]|uniref:hypothetical protein n=1 Tax=Nocardia sp. NPDC127606 TaxID=3345406 RepID=UPI00362E569F
MVMQLENMPLPVCRTASGFGAVIFDMDGIVTDTASVHAAAWKQRFGGVVTRTQANRLRATRVHQAGMRHGGYVREFERHWA